MHFCGKSPEFLSPNWGLKKELLQGLDNEGITVFGSQLHTHLTGIRVHTRHFDASGRELPELDRDNHYSTHFQEIRRLKRPVRVLPVSCKRTEIIRGVDCWKKYLEYTTGKINLFQSICSRTPLFIVKIRMKKYKITKSCRHCRYVFSKSLLATDNA